jgi:glycosyltransferase involved in cell wall biosynthesis
MTGATAAPARDIVPPFAADRPAGGTLVLLWRSLGPYHVARAAAASRLFGDRANIRVVVIQICDRENSRDWLPVNDGACQPVAIRTLAPGRALHAATPSLARPLYAQLASLRPVCIAVAGYDRPEMREALRWARRNGAAGVLMSETKWDDRPRPWWRRALAARAARLADSALVSGSAAAEYLVSLGFRRERIFQPYGVVDNAYFDARAALVRRNLKDGPIPGRYFLACSRLIEARKNLNRLFLAYGRYRERTAGVPWKLVVCGDGPDRPKYERFVRDHRIEGVTFAGFKQLDDLSLYYAHASCFVHPAVNEAWGLVVNEAMASGLPVLVSRRCGCAGDLVRDGVNGFAFDPHDIDALAGRLTAIATSGPEQLMRMRAASQAIVSRWGVDRFASGLWAAMEAGPSGLTARR